MHDTGPFSLGFIGGSLNSAVGYAHFVSCTMDYRWTLDAGCFSANTERNHETARAYGVSPERVYDDWRAMLDAEQGRLDALVILTPTPMHSDMVAECLSRGFPVICEKSLCTTSADARRIMQVRDANRGFLAVTYNYSGYPMVRELRNKIAGGDLGRIIHFQAEMPQEGYIRVDPRGNKPAPQSWRLSDGHVPVIHLDLGSHLHHMIYYMTGQRPVSVVSDQDSFGWFHGVTDNVTCLCRYTDGLQGQMWFSKSALGYRNGLRFRIYGTEASAEWYQLSPEEVLISCADGRRIVLDRAGAVQVADQRRYNRFKAGHPAGFVEAFANLYTDIADCLAQYRETGAWQSQNVFSAELALEGLLFFEAMEKSVAEKKWQQL